jgi:hypothetical protein
MQMHTLVHVARGPRSSVDTATLMTDYLQFDRQRRYSRHLMTTFTGFALLLLVGGAIGSVPRSESFEAAGMFIVPAGALLLANAWRRSRLNQRLHAIRAEIRQSAL